MPFTPFHLGPGVLFKAVGGRHFSFMVFGGAQVLMDIEPLVRIYRQDPFLHGPTHSVLGAFGIGAVAGVLGKPIGETLLRWSGIAHAPLTWPVSFLSAFIGTYSHIVLDGVMHRDMMPLWPLAGGNPLLGVIPVEALHLFCLACGVLGGLILARGPLRQLLKP
ncbi:MAG: metal-dependent hydrolase [Rhodospirillaceae bacterium]|nr:metal-dependent hydrolase [Rhodospirillaceae bacterium]